MTKMLTAAFVLVASMTAAQTSLTNWNGHWVMSPEPEDTEPSHPRTVEHRYERMSAAAEADLAAFDRMAGTYMGRKRNKRLTVRHEFTRGAPSWKSCSTLHANRRKAMDRWVSKDTHANEHAYHVAADAYASRCYPR